MLVGGVQFQPRVEHEKLEPYLVLYFQQLIVGNAGKFSSLSTC